MGCIYECNGFDEDAGLCTLWEGDKGLHLPGCGDDGICVVSEDPDPSYTCDSYESDYVCNDCGADLNVEGCDCDEFDDYV